MSEAIILKRKKRIVKELTKIFLIIALLLVFRSSFYEPYRIPSGSMIPTLKIGDFILVDKSSYGFKVPFSDISLLDLNWNPIYLFGKKNPQRGDVIVFKYPNDPTINFIKRVIGVPGDEIEIIDKVVYINGQALNINEIDGSEYMKKMDQRYKGHNLKFFRTKTGEHTYTIQQDMDNIYTSHLDKTIVPKGKFFVMGDNRDFSSDSRFWGFVPHEYIRGKAFLIWFSMTMPNSSEEIRIRNERIFKAID